MINPLHNPQIMQKNALIGVDSIPPIVKVSGKYAIKGKIAPVIKIVDMINYHFTMLSTLFMLAFWKVVAKN